MNPPLTPALRERVENTIRFLAADAVQRANSGHPGAPMGLARPVFQLWDGHLRFDPDDPAWPLRDRFILSAGHASMLLYALLHLYEYAVSLDDIASFRQLNSKTPGHPERGHAPGVEVTTGPLGQGFAHGVGMALAARATRARFAGAGDGPGNHFVYGVVSDGDLMEGISAEAGSLAGHWRLGNLIYLYDDNLVTIDGPTSLCFSENVRQRFEAQRWHVQEIDGEDVEGLNSALADARAVIDRPSLVITHTVIGRGSAVAGQSKAHGAPLGPDEVRLTKEAYGWDPDRTFYVPADALRVFRQAVPDGEDRVREWNEALARFADGHVDLAEEFLRRVAGKLPPGWDKELKRYEVGTEVATRNASQDAIQALAGPLPELFGGAADLSESNLTDIKDEPNFSTDEPGRNLRFGVREHAMGGVTNGIAYHGGFIPYDATFLTFSDYMRGAVRLSALAGLHVIDVWTHDSVGLGEDGPTHQPVEHYAALRAMPNLWFVRPGDANETSAAWALAIERRDGPIGLALTRQKLPVLEGTAEKAREGVRRGGYVLREASGGSPALILLATGSELQLAMGAAEELEDDGIATRVVSLPCWERFDAQDASYRDDVLPPAVRKRVSVEVGVPMGWERWVGDEGAIIGLDHFGASAPAGTIFEHFGFTAARVADVGRRVVRDGLRGRIGTLDGGHFAHMGSSGRHPTLRAGEAGVDRTDDSDPGHS